MPFCMAVFIKIITISLSEIVTLQVRIPKENIVTFICCRQRRKAFLSTSANGSMTLEATLVLSLLIFASVSLILPMKILDTERKIQAGLEAVGEDFSRYAYLQDVLLKGEEASAPGAGEAARTFCHNLQEGAAAGFVLTRMREYVDTDAVRLVTMERSGIMADGERFDLMLDYTIQMPFPVLGVNAIPRTARTCRRAWIGKPGKYGQSDGWSTEPEDEIVYVGKGSTRYHRDRNCHYLTNNLMPVAYESVADRRNQSGGKYYACAVCGRQAGAGSMVYILPEGSSYHSTQNCSAILAYVRAVRLSEVEHLGPCSYCSR